MDLELVSSKLCPFVQRCAITLNAKGVDHEVSYIDLDAPPAWFADASPLGLVPVLRVSDGESQEFIFESAVIGEFVDEVTGGGMMPNDPVQRALSRSWTEFASACVLDTHALTTAPTREAFEATVASLTGKLGKMEARFGEGPFWNGADLHLIDAAIAPLWVRLRALESFGVVLLDPERFPNLVDHAEAMLASSEVQDAVPEDFDALLAADVRARGGFLATGDAVVTLTDA